MMGNPPNGTKLLKEKDFDHNLIDPQAYDVFQTKVMQGPPVKNYMMTEFYFNKAG